MFDKIITNIFAICAIVFFFTIFHSYWTKGEIFNEYVTEKTIVFDCRVNGNEETN